MLLLPGSSAKESTAEMHSQSYGIRGLFLPQPNVYIDQSLADDDDDLFGDNEVMENSSHGGVQSTSVECGGRSLPRAASTDEELNTLARQRKVSTVIPSTSKRRAVYGALTVEPVTGMQQVFPPSVLLPSPSGKQSPTRPNVILPSNASGDGLNEKASDKSGKARIARKANPEETPEIGEASSSRKRNLDLRETDASNSEKAWEQVRAKIPRSTHYVEVYKKIRDKAELQPTPEATASTPREFACKFCKRRRSYKHRAKWEEHMKFHHPDERLEYINRVELLAESARKRQSKAAPEPSPQPPSPPVQESEADAVRQEPLVIDLTQS